MAEVTYDDRSFLVDGQRIWLVSGSVHYFRTPAALWPDRLLKAKRAGLNCVSTCIAWNLHEPIEGQWNLSGDLDIRAFVELASDMGLYVILQPGPYIGADWDFGGLPAWLTSKQGIAYRTSNAVYTHYYDKYFRQVLPRLAEHQVTRGGNIILIQNENKYVMTTMPDRLAYLEFISQLFRRSGFEIPIITCNAATDPAVPGAIDCASGADNAVAELKKLRVRQPNAPLLVTELRPGGPDAWGGPHHPADARATARKAMEILGCGAQYNYSMWHGGTNFAFGGGRYADGDATYQTTSYDFDAPLAEGGVRTEKYYLTRLVNMLACHMGRFLGACRMEESGVTVHDSTSVLNIYGPAGRWAVISNGGRDDIDSARISLPEARDLRVPLQPLGAAAVPVELRIGPECVLDYANLTPLGLFWDKVLLLHGPGGWEGRVSVNGQELRAVVPGGEDPTVIEHQGLFIVLLSSDLAMRTWFLDDVLIFGPRFVGATGEDVVNPPAAKQYAILAADGKLAHKKVKPAPAHKLTPPRLGAWRRISVCVEPVSEELEWRKLDRPRDAAGLGVANGYVWYRAEIPADAAGRRHIFLPGCEDRATIYLNGDLVGTWGRGPDAVQTAMAASFKRGRNVLTMLVDNLGRFSAGSRLGEPKGLFAGVYEAKPLQTRKPKLQPAEGFTRRLVPRQLVHLVPQLEAMRVFEADWDLSLTKVLPIHVSFTNLPHHAALMCNGRLVEFYPCEGGKNFGGVTLGSELKKGRNNLKLVLWGQVDPKVLEDLKLHVLQENLTEKAAWSCRAWIAPKPGGPVVGKDQPAWYVANFKYAPAGEPLFLHVVGAKKGQIFLNGHNAGRFWTVGPQEFYYLPECWLAAENELMIFEEQGSIPRRSRLEFLPRGPFRE